MKLSKNNKSKGFSILSILLVIVFVVGAIGAWALSGKSNTKGAGGAGAKIAASSIINDSSSLQLVYDTLVINGATPASITFTLDESSVSLLNSKTGIPAPSVPASALRETLATTEGYFVMNNQVAPNIVNDNNYHKTLLVAGVKNAVCSEINKIVNGVDTIPVFASFTASTQFVTGATKSSPNTTITTDFKSNGLTGAVAENWRHGCISSSNTVDNNVYFRIID